MTDARGATSAQEAPRYDGRGKWTGDNWDLSAVAGLSKAPSGQYMVPACRTNEERTAAMKGPMALVIMRNPVIEGRARAAMSSSWVTSTSVIFSLSTRCSRSGCRSCRSRSP